MSDLALTVALRVLTHSRVFTPATPGVHTRSPTRSAPNCVLVNQGSHNWAIFRGLVDATQAIGNLIPDAWFAALAIEQGCEWVTDDADFGRFPGLRWRRPG